MRREWWRGASWTTRTTSCRSRTTRRSWHLRSGPSWPALSAPTAQLPAPDSDYRSVRMTRRSSTRRCRMQLVVFALGDEEYGLPITQVQEIIRFSDPRSIPNPHASIRGVINLRGRIIPVCDLKLQLDVAAAPVADEDCKIVIVESAAGS